MIPLTDTKRIKLLFKLMIIGSIVSLTLVIGYNKYEQKRYPKIAKEDSIEGIIKKLRPYQSVAKVEMDDERRFMIIGSLNYNYEPSITNEFLREGDFIMKKKNSDTLYIKRENDIFWFILGGVIWNDK
jgi:hypothetical protein